MKKDKEEVLDDQKENRIFKSDVDDDARSSSKYFTLIYRYLFIIIYKYIT